MTAALFVKAISKFLLGVVLVGALIFVPAGTLFFPNGWLLMGLLFIPMFGAGLVMMVKNPQLLQSRLVAKERRRTQDQVVKLSAVMFMAGFILAGLGFRLGWYRLPGSVTAGASLVFAVAYILYAQVLRENAWLSRTIQVQAGQQVVDTGLYGWVRHPMYSATLLLFLSMPLVLGSLHAFVVFLLYPLLIVRRLKDEEALLVKELPGYQAYQQKVKYRLLPFIW